MEGDDLDVAAILPVGANLIAGKCEAVVARIGVFRIGRRRGAAGDVVVPLLRQSRPHPPMALNEELREVPLAAGDVVELHGPAAVFLFLPAANGDAAADDRAF